MQIFVSRDGQQFGPYTTEQVQESLGNGALLPTDLVWYEGLDGWKPITSIFQSAAPEVQQPCPAPVSRRPTLNAPARPAKAAGQSRYPTIPQRAPSNRRPVPAAPRKSRVPFWVGISLAGLLTIWLGSTLLIGIATKSQIEKGLQQNKLASLGSYKMGLFSSKATTLIHLGDTENLDEAGKLYHRIYHGPIVISERKKGLGAGYMTTSFAEAEQKKDDIPFTLLTEVSLSGHSDHSLILDPIDFEDGDFRLKFDGGRINFKANRDRTHFTGSIDLSPVKMVLKDGDISVDATRGVMDIRTDGSVEVDATIGGMRIVSIGGGAEQSFTIKPPKLQVKYRYHSKDLPIHVGKSSLTFPEMRVEGTMPASLRNLAFHSSAFVDRANKFNASVIYEIGGATIGEASEPIFDLDKTSLELGYNGFDAKVFAQIAEENRRYWGPYIRMLLDLDDIASLQTDDDSQRTLNRIITLWLDLVRPGTELFAKVNISGTDGIVDLSAAFGGEKNLTDTKNLREVLSALEAKMKIKVQGDLLESPLVAMGIQGYAESGMGKLEQSGFQFDSEVREGTVFLGEQATPIIEALGPKLDEPINWEEILAAIQSSGLEPDA